MPTGFHCRSKLAVKAFRNIWYLVPTVFDQHGNGLRILTVIFGRIVVVQFFAPLDMERVNQYDSYARVLKILCKVKPIMACWFHPYHNSILVVFFLQLIDPNPE